jgi:hypothetical protein
MNGY